MNLGKWVLFANPKFAEREDMPLVAVEGMVGLYARQNGLAERRNVPQKAAE
jgi:hypothetical protein